MTVWQLKFDPTFFGMSDLLQASKCCPALLWCVFAPAHVQSRGRFSRKQMEHNYIYIYIQSLSLSLSPSLSLSLSHTHTHTHTRVNMTCSQHSVCRSVCTAYRHTDHRHARPKLQAKVETLILTRNSTYTVQPNAITDKKTAFFLLF